MSGSKWVTTPLWLSGSWRSFLYRSSVFLPLLLNVFCFCYVHTTSIIYCAHHNMKYSLGIFNFLEDISSLSNSVVFLYFFALITEEGFLSLLAILWNSAFKWVFLSFSPLLFTSCLFTAICKASSDNQFAFCIYFSWGWSWSLPPVLCPKPPFIDLQKLCLSDLIPWIYFSFPLYNHWGFDLGHTWMV